jgi:hypothetical protein
VSYVLNVPGGFIYGLVDGGSRKNSDAANWDESELENYFKTLRIVESV